MSTILPRTLPGKALETNTERLLKRIAAHKSNYWLGFLTDPAMAVFFLIWTVLSGESIIVTVAGYTVGLLSWTLFEYCFHRWIYHRGKTLAHAGHQLHHQSPRTLIGMPWFLTSSFLAGIWYVFGCRFGVVVPLAFMAGLVTGFNVYGVFHHIHHHRDVRLPWYRKIRVHHMIHHRYPDVNFGVTTSFWDTLLGTTYFAKYGRSRTRRRAGCSGSVLAAQYQNRGSEKHQED